MGSPADGKSEHSTSHAPH